MTFVGGPLDSLPDGADMRTGKVRASRGKRKRLTSLTDELRDLRASDPLIAETPRDPTALTDGEKRASYDMLDGYVGDLNQHVAAKMQAVDLWRLEDWQDVDSGGTQGLIPSEQAALHREGEKVIDGMSARDFRQAQREQEKRQEAAGISHELQQRQANLLDTIWERFQQAAPDLANLQPELIADAARRHAESLAYSENDFMEDGKIIPEAIDGFAQGVAEDLRASGWGQGAARQADRPAGSSTAELIRSRNEQEDF